MTKVTHGTSPPARQSSSFVKLDLETGRPMYSTTPDGFEERQPVKIPEVFYGHTFTASERGRLQDGKSLLVSDLVGPGNQPLPSYYLKVNAGNGMLGFHPEDPDRKRTNTAAGKPQQSPTAKRGPKVG